MSSVIDGFGHFREAARRGIELANCQPVLVNEDFPAQEYSSRNICLDAVATCDCVLLIIGERGGWTAPSGKLVVEEELEEARRHQIPLRVFVQKIKRDSAAARLVNRVSDYVDGSFRSEFADAAELERIVETSLKRTMPYNRAQGVNFDFEARMNASFAEQQAPLLRLVAAPAREDEMFDPVELRSEEFRRRIFELGHKPEIALFDYSKAKSFRFDEHSLTIVQESQWNPTEPMLYVRVRIEESGAVTLDGNPTGRTARQRDLDAFPGMAVATDEIEMLVEQFLRFVTALHSEFDRYGRFEQLQYNVGLKLQPYGTVVKSKEQSNTRVMNMFTGQHAHLIAHDSSRSLLRNAGETIVMESKRTALRLYSAAAGPHEA